MKFCRQDAVLISHAASCVQKRTRPIKPKFTAHTYNESTSGFAVCLHPRIPQTKAKRVFVHIMRPDAVCDTAFVKMCNLLFVRLHAPPPFLFSKSNNKTL